MDEQKVLELTVKVAETSAKASMITAVAAMIDASKGTDVYAKAINLADRLLTEELA